MFLRCKSMEDTFNSYINPILTKCIKNTVLTKGELIIMDSYKSLFAIDYLIKKWLFENNKLWYHDTRSYCYIYRKIE